MNQIREIKSETGGASQFEYTCCLCFCEYWVFSPPAEYNEIGPICENCENETYIVVLSNTRRETQQNGIGCWSKIFDNFQDAFDFWNQDQPGRTISLFGDLELKKLIDKNSATDL